MKRKSSIYKLLETKGMIYFGRITEGTLENTTFLVTGEKELYLEANAYDLPDDGYGFLHDDQYVYGVKWLDKQYCAEKTTKIPLLFFYDAAEWDIQLTACRRIEYTSAALRRIMCTYKTSEDNMLKFIDDAFIVGDVTIRFSGNPIYSEPKFMYYEIFNPTIIIETTNPLEPDQVWKYVQAIDNFLRLVFFEKRTALPDIRLVGDEDRYLAFYVVPNDTYWKYYPADFQNVYDKIKSSIPIIFNYILNKRIDSSFFIKCTMCENMRSLFIDTYSNFDKLSDQASYGLAERNEEFENFKSKIWATIENDEDYEKVKEQVGSLRDKILSHGIKVGHKEKLKRAFDDILKVIPERARDYGLYDEDIINHIYKLRIDIIHKGKVIDFTGRDMFCLEILQWITYLILLRLIGINDILLEDWMNRVMGVG